MAGTLFAIKDAIDLKLTKVGESTVYTVIDYLNDVQIQMDCTSKGNSKTIP